MISPDPDFQRQKEELETYLYAAVYRHEKLLQVRAKAQHQLREMFDYYSARPAHLPELFRDRIDRVGPRRSAADYLAGMTDRFFQRTYREVISKTRETT